MPYIETVHITTYLGTANSHQLDFHPIVMVATLDVCLKYLYLKHVIEDFPADQVQQFVQIALHYLVQCLI